MTIDKGFLIFVVAVAVIFTLVLACMSANGSTLPAFDPKLETWTKWVASVVGIIVSARVLWSGAALLQKKADKA